MLNRILSFYTKTFVLWVLLFGVLAYYFPVPFALLGKGYTTDILFACTMFGIGAVLRVEDFQAIAKKPWIVLLGVAAQFTIMPLGAYAVAKATRLPPELAVGLILTASAPGAMTSNVLCYIARADTAYSISLTTVSTLLCALLTPALTTLLAREYLPVEFWKMFFYVVRIVVIPLTAGFAVKYSFRKKMERIEPVFPAISVTFIILICAMVIGVNHKYIPSVTAMVLAGVLFLNLYGMAMGYGVGWVFRLARRRRRTLCIEIGMQNAGLGMVLALRHFDERAALPAVVFVFVCIITAAIMVEVWQRGDQAGEEGQ